MWWGGQYRSSTVILKGTILQPYIDHCYSLNWKKKKSWQFDIGKLIRRSPGQEYSTWRYSCKKHIDVRCTIYTIREQYHAVHTWDSCEYLNMRRKSGESGWWISNALDGLIEGLLSGSKDVCWKLLSSQSRVMNCVSSSGMSGPGGILWISIVL